MALAAVDDDESSPASTGRCATRECFRRGRVVGEVGLVDEDMRKRVGIRREGAQRLFRRG